MQINSCQKCSKVPFLVMPEGLTSNIVTGAQVRHHHHELDTAYLECDCGQTPFHASDLALINEWNIKQDNLKQEAEALKAHELQEAQHAVERLERDQAHAARVEKDLEMQRMHGVLIASDLPVANGDQ